MGGGEYGARGRDGQGEGETRDQEESNTGGANDKAGQTSPLWGLAFGTSVCWSAQLFCPSGGPEDQQPKLQPSQTPAELGWGLTYRQKHRNKETEELKVYFQDTSLAV